MLNPNAKKWVRALRSGKYKQATGNLHNSDGYCCLGVACELAIKNGVRVKKEDHEDRPTVYDGMSDLLPLSVQRWLNLNSDDGVLTLASDEETSLANLNDNGSNFKQIADIIVKYQDQLFKDKKKKKVA